MVQRNTFIKKLNQIIKKRLLTETKYECAHTFNTHLRVIRSCTADVTGHWFDLRSALQLLIKTRLKAEYQRIIPPYSPEDTKISGLVV